MRTHIRLITTQTRTQLQAHSFQTILCEKIVKKECMRMHVRQLTGALGK